MRRITPDFSLLNRILTVALPMIGALLAQIGLEVTDTFMMGQLGYRELASGGLAASLYIVAIIISVGIFSAIGVFAAKQKGKNNNEVENIIAAGAQLAIILAPIGVIAVMCAPWLLHAMGQDPDIVVQAEDFLEGVVIGFPAILVYLICREYLASIENTTFIMVISVLGIPLNLVLNYAFMYGIPGLIPAMGLTGVGLASGLIEWLAAGALCIYIHYRLKFRPKLFQSFKREHMIELLKLGAPVAMTMLLEVILFSAASVLAGYLGSKPLAAHQIAFQVISILIMIPIGLSQASGVLVSQAVENEPDKLSNWIMHFIVLCLGSSLLAAAFMILIPGSLVGIFIHEEVHPDLLENGIRLLKIAAFFQFFDALQVLFNGILRGMKDTLIPMLLNFATYILLGVLIAYELAFRQHLGIEGVWLGLATGVITTCICLGIRIFYLLKKNTVPLASTFDSKS